METGKIKFTAGINGSIVVEIYDSGGEPQDLTNCTITLNLAYEYDDKALISLPMIVFDTNKCSASINPSDTEILNVGEYEMQLIIVDANNKKHATEKTKISIYQIIK